MAMDLVQAVASMANVGSTQLKLQNTTNKHLVSLHDTTKSNGKELLAAVNDVKKTQEDLSLMAEVQGLRDEIRLADKMRRIEFAIQNVKLLCKDFKIYRAVYTGTWNQDGDKKYAISTPDPEHLLLNILLFFRKGVGYYIDTFYIEDPDNKRFMIGQFADNTTTELPELEEYETFRDKLADKLHMLLGKEPSFRDTSGRIAVYYD